MDEIYKRVAEAFAKRINEAFESEDALKKEFERNFPNLPFDRTDYWGSIVYRMMRDAWVEAGPEVKVEPTGYDKLSILKALHPLLDYNLFSQALLNLQGYTGMAYLTGDAVKEIERIKAAWPKDAKLNPFDPKAKQVKVAATEEEKAYNNALSTLRSLRLISQFTPQISFRVSPKGSTPAFADSRNISMIGAGGDKYLKLNPGLRAYYVVWEPGATPKMAAYTANNVLKTMVFDAPGIPYSFFSKSGGEMLQEVLFVRRLMYEIFAAVDATKEPCIMVPRVNSLLVVARAEGGFKAAFDQLKGRWPVISLVEGPRA